MTDITQELIQKLEHLSTETRLPLEKRLIDTAVWYHKNKDRIPKEDLGKRLDFMEKTFDIFLEMIAMSVDRMQISEGRSKSENLWLPNGIVDMDTGKRYG
jgi:hypothetical protein